MIDRYVMVPEAALNWLFGHQTGASSKAMFAKFTGAHVKGSWHPIDAGDFGRCLDLLETVPEWKGRVAEMAMVSSHWAALVDVWDRLETLHQEGDMAECSKLIQESVWVFTKGPITHRMR